MRILILVNTLSHLDENPALLSAAFVARGWHVRCGLLHTLALRDGRVRCRVAEVARPMRPGDPLTAPSRVEAVDDSDLAWIMNRPHPALATDIWQLVWLLQQRSELANSVESLVFLNNKHVVSDFTPEANRLETHIANDFEALWSIHASEPRRPWVVKPTNGYCGAEVYLLQPGDTNARPLLQAMTGNTAALAELSDAGLLGVQNRYAILQAYAPEVRRGEKRVILAGGDVVAVHGRMAAEHDHRSNLVQGGELLAAELDDEERALCERVGAALLRHGVRFCGLDVAWPYLIEFNLVNPGGLGDVLALTGVDRAPAAVERVLARCRVGVGQRAH